jgi:hypothetical protein
VDYYEWYTFQSLCNDKVDAFQVNV